MHPGLQECMRWHSVGLSYFPPLPRKLWIETHGTGQWYWAWSSPPIYMLHKRDITYSPALAVQTTKRTPWIKFLNALPYSALWLPLIFPLLFVKRRWVGGDLEHTRNESTSHQWLFSFQITRKHFPVLQSFHRSALAISINWPLCLTVQPEFHLVNLKRDGVDEM